MSKCFLVLTVAAAFACLLWMSLVVVNTQHLLATRQARSAGEAFSRSVATPIW